MRKLIAGLMIGALAATFAFDAEAQRRFGGGRTVGKQSPQVQQRQAAPQQQTQQPAQQQPAASPATQQAGAAAAARSPWRGALMGLAAGLGIAALASWLGLSEALTMILTVLLVGMAVMLLVGFVLRRMRGTPQPAYASPRSAPPGTYGNVGYEAAPLPAARPPATSDGIRPGSAMDQLMRGNGSTGSTTPWGIPAGFDTTAFLGAAKANYARLQTAWDSGNLADLEEFTTNEMFITLTHDLHERRGKSQTEVVALDAELLGIESTADEHMASVKFDGTLKVDGEIERVSEVWNLTKPARGGGWVLAGIQQLN